MARKYGLYVNGQYVHTTQWLPVPKSTRPNELLGEVAHFDSKHDDDELREAALEGLHQTYRQIRFEGFFPLKERLAFLKRLRLRLEDQRENLAQLIMNEVGKPIAQARSEVDRACATLQWTLEEAEVFFAPSPLPTQARPEWQSFEGEVLREARGVLLAMSPFNFPLNLVMHKLAPAIAAGCPVLLKPSSKAALSALCLVDYCHAEGLPPGMLNFFSCANHDVPALIQDKRIAQISFTGSVPVGWALKKQTTKPFTLELGGAAPAFVGADANLEAAAEALAKSATAYAGQVCISTQSVHIETSVYARFKELFETAFDKIVWGLQSRDDVICGPVIDAQARDRLEKLRTHLSKIGSNQHATRRSPEDPEMVQNTLVRPAFFEGIPDDDAFYTDECFGPFVALRKIQGASQFLEFANALPQRLQVSIWGQADSPAMHKLVANLDYGGVIVNESPSIRFDAMPYGGRGGSGAGREGPRYALAEFTDYKAILIRS